MILDFPGGTVNRNLSANAGNTGSIRGPGRFHMMQSNYPCKAMKTQYNNHNNNNKRMFFKLSTCRTKVGISFSSGN